MSVSTGLRMCPKVRLKKPNKLAVKRCCYTCEHCTAQWCVLTISVPLGVGQAPVDNSRGSYKIKNVAQKKLVSFGTFRLIPYIQKNWILSTMNLPVQDLIRQKCFFGRCKNWRFQFQKWKVTCWLDLQFSTFCTFFNWFRKSCNQIF
jgi:hypothetical protein